MAAVHCCEMEKSVRYDMIQESSRGSISCFQTIEYRKDWKPSAAQTRSNDLAVWTRVIFLGEVRPGSREQRSAEEAEATAGAVGEPLI